MYMVTDGKRRPITCPECGCRLATSVLFEDVAIAFHFIHEYSTEHDAQGHKCSDIGVVWNLGLHKTGAYYLASKQ